MARPCRQVMVCDKCGSRIIHVVYVRTLADGRRRRRRECQACGYRFTTEERRLSMK